MKVVLLAGGFGTRISEESQFRPKPMIEIGGMPILWHIMKNYYHSGLREFIICAGYKQEVIKKWFSDYYINTSDVTFDFSAGNEIQVHRQHSEDWKITIVNTGLNTMTGGRLKRIGDYLDNEPFLMTYGDGVSNVDIQASIEFHKAHNKRATITVVHPEGRFGYIDLTGDEVRSFREKNAHDVGWINAGFMVLNPNVLDEVAGDDIMFEREPMERIAAQGEMMCFKHQGFWQCMDTARDKEMLEKLWNKGNAPWKNW